MTQPEQPDVPYRVQISAYYATPEGQGLESLDVTWDQVPDQGALAEVVGQLLPRGRVPAGRQVPSPDFPPGDLAGDACRRVLCGHPRANHDDKDFHGRATGVGRGACRLCISAAKCEYFVGFGGS